MSSVPVSLKPVRNIIGGGLTIVADAVIAEHHDDELVMTDQPVEQGSTITDNAYKLPAELELTYAWSLGSPQNTGMDLSFLKNLYQQLLGFQVNRTLLTVNTGKRVYQNMLVRIISVPTDQYNENSMTVRLLLQEVLLATTQVVPLTSAAVQQFPQQTAPVQNQGGASLQPAPNFNPSGLP